MTDITDLIQRNLPRIAAMSIEPDADLDALGADAISRMGLAMDIEAQTGREVPDAEAEGWATVGDVIESLGR